MPQKIAPRELPFLSMVKAAHLLQAGETTSVELTRACLRNIEARDAELHAFITVMSEAALRDAAVADAEISAGRVRSPLHGIPIAIKDLIDIAGVKTTAGSALFAERVAQRDAPVVRRLRAAGAVLLGKTNLHEFAYGCSSVVTAYGAVRNPLAPEYIAGGSSGGSAAALAAGMCLGAIGTDTAGSIRLPAAYCGVVGLKPSFGAWPTEGVIPLSWSMDHVGPMARTVADTAILHAVLFGRAEMGAKISAQDAEAGIGELRVGVPRSYFWESLESDIEQACVDAVHRLEGVAASIAECSIPINNDRTVQASESFAYHRKWAETSPGKYQPETLRRIQAGAKHLAADYIDAVHDLQNLRDEASKIFTNVDVLITPTAPISAMKVEQLLAEADQLRAREILMLRNTRPFNVLGLPTISVPCGKTQNGLPVGLQITGAPGRDEMELMTVARVVEEQVAGTR